MSFKKATCPYPESTFLLEPYNAIERFLCGWLRWLYKTYEYTEKIYMYIHTYLLCTTHTICNYNLHIFTISIHFHYICGLNRHPLHGFSTGGLIIIFINLPGHRPTSSKMCYQAISRTSEKTTGETRETEKVLLFFLDGKNPAESSKWLWFLALFVLLCRCCWSETPLISKVLFCWGIYIGAVW